MWILPEGFPWRKITLNYLRPLAILDLARQTVQLQCQASNGVGPESPDGKRSPVRCILRPELPEQGRECASSMHYPFCYRDSSSLR